MITMGPSAWTMPINTQLADSRQGGAKYHLDLKALLTEPTGDAVIDQLIQ